MGGGSLNTLEVWEGQGLFDSYHSAVLFCFVLTKTEGMKSVQTVRLILLYDTNKFATDLSRWLWNNTVNYKPECQHLEENEG